MSDNVIVGSAIVSLLVNAGNDAIKGTVSPKRYILTLSAFTVLAGIYYAGAKEIAVSFALLYLIVNLLYQGAAVLDTLTKVG